MTDKKRVKPITGSKELKQFMSFLLNDISCLERMLSEGIVESGVRRIGAEQELCLVDSSWLPAPVVTEIVDKIGDPHFNFEIARFNVEINLDPAQFEGSCLSDMERQLGSLIGRLESVAKEIDVKTVMAGILPTIRRSDLDLDNLTPKTRFCTLVETLNNLTGCSYELNITGTDELITTHDSPMFESCNTSFQIHLQIEPEDAVSSYNIAQALAAPVLAAATNSPILLGRRLWKETRIALFQQSIDTRDHSHEREISSRVTFGSGWVKDSILEIFQDDIARHRVLVHTEIEKDSLETLDEGDVPQLKALQTFNGTIYRWNRLCYGINEGKPNLRIENRTLPSGPTVKDEIANTAFWLGLMNGMPAEHENISYVMDFADVKTNFFKAAQEGLDTQFKWTEGKVIPADELILDELLPLAEKGLQMAGIKRTDTEEYLEIIRERVSSRKTGSSWMLESFSKLTDKGTKDEAAVSLTAGMYRRQRRGNPVHRWTLATVDKASGRLNEYWRVEQIMSTDLFTVQQTDPIHLAANIMDWKDVRHVPVEDKDGKLVGLVTAGNLLRYYGKSGEKDAEPPGVNEIMVKKPVTVPPEAPTMDAISLMHENKISCLPVVKDRKLVGIVTEFDFMNLLANLVEELSEKDK